MPFAQPNLSDELVIQLLPCLETENNMGAFLPLSGPVTRDMDVDALMNKPYPISSTQHVMNNRRANSPRPSVLLTKP